MTRRSSQKILDGTLHPPMRMAAGGICFDMLFVVAGSLLWACSASYPTVVKIKFATVPMGGTVDRLSDPIREDQSLRFTWNIETRLERAQYLEWVTAELWREGFTVRQRQEQSVTLGKLDDGDAYRINIEVTQEHSTRVHVTVTVSPG